MSAKYPYPKIDTLTDLIVLLVVICADIQLKKRY